MKKKLKRVWRIIFYTTYVIFFSKAVLIPILNRIAPLGPYYTDVAKRVSSPDGTKTALLIRRNGFDLNYGVQIQTNRFFTKEIHWSRDFLPDLTEDWNEKLVWSDDSSILVMQVDNISNENKKYMWAYDFKKNQEYLDNDTINKILHSESFTTDSSQEEVDFQRSSE